MVTASGATASIAVRITLDVDAGVDDRRQQHVAAGPGAGVDPADHQEARAAPGWPRGGVAGDPGGEDTGPEAVVDVDDA